WRSCAPQAIHSRGERSSDRVSSTDCERIIRRAVAGFESWFSAGGSLPLRRAAARASFFACFNSRFSRNAQPLAPHSSLLASSVLPGRRALRPCRLGRGFVPLSELFVDPVVCCARWDAQRTPDLVCEQLPGLAVKTLLGHREIHSGAASLGLSASAISDHFGEADRCPSGDLFVADP